MINEIVGSVRVFPHGWNQQTYKLPFLPLHCYPHICATVCSNLRAESLFTCMVCHGVLLWLHFLSSGSYMPYFRYSVKACWKQMWSWFHVSVKHNVKKLFTFLLFKVDFYWFMTCCDIRVFLLPWVYTVPGLSTFRLFCALWLAHASVPYMQFMHIVALCFFWIGEAITCVAQSWCEENSHHTLASLTF